MKQPVQGFSKLTKEEKINWLAHNCFTNPAEGTQLLQKYWHPDAATQKLHDEFIENTLSNFLLPIGVAPNFMINNRLYAVPMAIEESSVVAAASKAAKFWLDRGGFKTTILGTEKVGQVHFMYHGDTAKLQLFFESVSAKLRTDAADITRNMEKRGGGISSITLIDKTDKLPNYFQMHCTFETLDAMGANFINSCLEQFAKTFKAEAQHFDAFTEAEKDITIVMSILSNYVPGCVVRAEVSCAVEALNEDKDITPELFAEKFVQAVAIANVEPYRAVTHNKGIMNGIDAVVLATGNDFRAIEAAAHAYAAKDGSYSSLTHATVEDGVFRFWIEVPLAMGTVGGLTQLHPMVKVALDMLGNPDAKELMEITAVAGLAQNFGAVRSLITSGIQKGHMKMHLLNILNQLGATEAEKQYFVNLFKDKTATHSTVVAEFEKLRATT